jgi:hypothetical protein
MCANGLTDTHISNRTMTCVTQSLPQREVPSLVFRRLHLLASLEIRVAQQSTAAPFPLAYTTFSSDIRPLGCLSSESRADRDNAHVVWSVCSRHLTLVLTMCPQLAVYAASVLSSCHLYRLLGGWLFYFGPPAGSHCPRSDCTLNQRLE